MTKESSFIHTLIQRQTLQRDIKIVETNDAAALPIVSYWEELNSLSVEQVQQLYRDAQIPCDYVDMRTGFRALSIRLFERQLITMEEYVSIFGGQAANYLSLDANSRFYDMKTGQDASSLTHIYSRAKYGSIEDIRFLANIVITMLSEALDNVESRWHKLFMNAKLNNENVILMTTGWRNVPSTANVLYDIVVTHINLKLAGMGLPTIINVKLPRIAPPCENYASLTPKERESVNLTQDHVIPDKNFYRGSGVHVIFGDDVLVTGATADKVCFESMTNGAKTFQAIYPVAIDPVIALRDAATEEKLNTAVVKGHLDEIVAMLLSHVDYQPILRTLRLLFNKSNHSALRDFLPKVPLMAWLKLYTSALGNELLQQEECIDSLTLLKEHLIRAGLLNASGVMPIIR